MINRKLIEKYWGKGGFEANLEYKGGPRLKKFEKHWPKGLIYKEKKYLCLAQCQV